jgi:small subunit ribosomal protein S16
LAVKVRLTRVGSKKNPIWRVVVADGRSPRDGRSIETIGHYNPQTQPSRIEIDRERLQHWLDRGAQPSNTVKKLIRAENTGYDMPSSAAPVAAPAAAPEAAAEVAPDAEATPEPDATPAPEADAAPSDETPPAENEAGKGGPGEEPSADVPEGDVAADESEAPADADENP